MANNWKEVWSKRSADKGILSGRDEKKVFLELKRSNGFDVVEDGGPEYEAWLRQYRQIKHELAFDKDSEINNLNSVYEVGCGSGANLYLFEKEGIRCGGIDYSENQINTAKHVLETEDIACDEAINLQTDNKYDAILSNSVFSYFEDEKYALTVLEKMYQKAVHSIGIIDIHDIDKKDEYLSYRKANITDYEEKYKDLPKFFYSKQFFLDFAFAHDMDIKFSFSDVENYWNNKFVFNCYMYKKKER